MACWRERERERERESSWSTIKQKERSTEIGGEINWDDVFYFATSYCKRTRIRKKNKGRQRDREKMILRQIVVRR